MNRPVLVVLLSLLSLLSSGCGSGGPKLYSIKGQVTHNGKPVKYLMLSFIPDDENTKATSTGSTDEEGRFEMMIGSTPGVFPGPHTITASDPLIVVGSKSSTEPEYLAVIAKYAPGKSPLKMNIEKSDSNLQLKLD